MRALNQATSLYWAIQEDALKTLLAVLSRESSDIEGAMMTQAARQKAFDEYMEALAKDDEIDLKALQAVQGEKMAGTRRVTIRGNTAVLRIEGVIIRRADLFSEISGAVSVERLAQDFTMAVNDEKVENIILYIDSPGGELNGVNEFATMIFEARSKKKIIAYSGGYLCSAAYWLGSAAESITVNDTAVVGSIGVLCACFDTKIAMGMAGYKELDFVSSQSPRKNLDPDTKDGREAIQATVDSLAEVFVAAIAKHRGVTSKKVLEDFGQGGVLVGQAAVGAGMVDKLGSFEQGLAEAQAIPQLPAGVTGEEDKGKDKADAGSQSITAAAEDAAATTDEGDVMDFKKWITGLSKSEREAAAQALQESEDGGEEPKKTVTAATEEPKKTTAATATQGQPGATGETVSLEEVTRLRTANEENTRKIEVMEAAARVKQAKDYTSAQLTSHKIVPAESASLEARYLSALNDDVMYPVAQGEKTRVQQIEEAQSARPAHILTTETMKNGVPAGAIVLENAEGESELDGVRAQAERYADTRNRSSRAATAPLVN